ncbi:hypothetical protein L0337_00315 [candidate division KSB1 bacterium]|nr:hypothetical protein [candidate division KSB1 bacterium]
MTGHTGTAWSVALSPDEQRLASSGEDKTVKLWRLSDSGPLQTLKIVFSLFKIYFLPPNPS